MVALERIEPQRRRAVLGTRVHEDADRPGGLAQAVEIGEELIRLGAPAHLPVDEIRLALLVRHRYERVVANVVCHVVHELRPHDELGGLGRLALGPAGDLLLHETELEDLPSTVVQVKERDERTIPQGVIYSMFDPAKHILREAPNETIMEMFFSGDGGLSDPTSISCNIIARKDTAGKPIYKLYRVANWYYSGGEKALSTQAREIVGNFVPYCRNKYGRRESCWKIDPACKALRKELEVLGIYTDAADNNGHDIKGSSKGIKVGIEYLQSAMQDGLFFCVDDEKYGQYNFLKEIGLYCVDDNGNPIDAYNHALDECRYACNYFYKRYVL